MLLKLLFLALNFTVVSFHALADEPGNFISNNSNHQIKFYQDLEYARVDDQPLLLDLYVPENVSTPPLIVWMHGGGWAKGDKSKINRAVVKLSEKGYAIASINYRLGGLYLHPRQIHDVKGAVRWLRASAMQFGYDKNRVAAGGGSAGGHLALLLALSADVAELEGVVGGNLQESSRVQAVLNLFGPSNLVTYAKENKRFGQNKSDELLKSASPLTYLSNDDPPLLSIHGDRDPVVPLSQSQKLHESYLKKGLDSRLVVIAGGQHGGRIFTDQERFKLMLDFFDAKLKNLENFSENKISGSPVPELDKIPSKFHSQAPQLPVDLQSDLYGFHWIIGPKSGISGSDKKFAQLLSTVDKNLQGNRGITGVYLITHWNLFEKNKGDFDFERLDQLVRLIKKNKRYYKLAMVPGIYTPEWVYDSGAEKFSTLGSNKSRTETYNKPIEIPVPWNRVYLDHYFSAVAELANHFANDISLHAITLTPAAFMSPEWHLPHSAADREHWKQLGGYEQKLLKVWQDALDKYAELFPQQKLVIEASSYPIGLKNLGDTIVEYSVRHFGGRVAVQINQLMGRFDQSGMPTLAKLMTYREQYGDDIIIGLQNLKGWSFPAISERQGSMEMTTYNFIQADGEFWELWFGDGKNSDTVMKLQKLWDEGKKLGARDMKQKLIEQGVYVPGRRTR